MKNINMTYSQELLRSEARGKDFGARQKQQFVRCQLKIYIVKIKFVIEILQILFSRYRIFLRGGFFMNLEKFLRENDAKIQTQADKNADHVFSSKSDWYKDDIKLSCPRVDFTYNLCTTKQ